MLNSDYRITPHNSVSCFVRWTSAWATGVSWIFVNGKHSRGPIYAETAERVVRIPFAQDAVKCIEIHDFSDDAVVPSAIEVQPNTRPLIGWNASADAERYRIYHSVRGGSESLIYDRAATDGIEHYEVLCPVALDGLGGVWHSIRVEAVDEYGNESTRACWTYFATDLPGAPANILVTAGSAPGTYTFEVEE